MNVNDLVTCPIEVLSTRIDQISKEDCEKLKVIRIALASIEPEILIFKREKEIDMSDLIKRQQVLWGIEYSLRYKAFLECFDKSLSSN